MLQELRKLFYSDTRVIITEGDITNPTVVFTGTVYEIPSNLHHRVIDADGVRVRDNTLVIHLIKGFRG